MISRSNISKELTPNLGNTRRSNKMATRGTIEKQNKDRATEGKKKKKKAKPRVDDFSGMTVADVEKAARESFKEHQRGSKIKASGKIKTDPLGRFLDDLGRRLPFQDLKQSKDIYPGSELWGRSTPEKVKILKARQKKKATKKASGGMNRVGLSPAEETRSGTPSEAARRRNMKKGGAASSKSRKIGKGQKKIKKYAVGGQGYTAREDESLGMRTGPERSKSQSMAARRDESYGDWGKRRRGRVNVKKGGSIGAALRGGGAVTR